MTRLLIALCLALQAAPSDAALKKEVALLEKRIKAKGGDVDALIRIIPLYHRLKKDKQAEDSVAKLRKLKKDGKVKEDSFLREEFQVEERFGKSKAVRRTVRVEEYFEPTPGETTSQRPVFWMFRVPDDEPSEPPLRTIFLEISTEVSKARGVTVWSLDENHTQGGDFVWHAAYGEMMEKVPSYGEMRKMAVEVLQGKADHMRSSSGTPASRYSD